LNFQMMNGLSLLVFSTLPQGGSHRSKLGS
jgi:hypothetical protein